MEVKEGDWLVKQEFVGYEIVDILTPPPFFVSFAYPFANIQDQDGKQMIGPYYSTASIPRQLVLGS